MKKFIVILVLLCSVTAFGAALYTLPSVGDIDTWGTNLNAYLNAVKVGVNVVEYGAVGDGTTDDETAIEQAIAAAAINGGIVFFPSTGNAYKFLTAITVPSNVTLQFEPGASIMGDGSSVLTINGRITDIQHQIFQSTMTVAGLSRANTAWWGAVGDGDSNSAATNATAIQAAIDSLVDTGILLIPTDTDDMYFDTGIVFNVPKGTFDSQVDLIYTSDTGAAWTVGTGAAGGYIEYVTGRIKTLSRSTQDWTDTVSGFRWDGSRSSSVQISRISDFTYNIELASTNLNNNYHNTLYTGYSQDAKIHVYFNGGEGRMNRNSFYGPKCSDSGNGASYVGTYGIYMPRELTSQTNSCKFYDLAFEWTTDRVMTNNIYCGGEYNSFFSPSLIDGSCADVRFRFHASTGTNIVTLAYSASTTYYDASELNNIIAIDYMIFNGVKIHRGTDYDSNYHTYSAGDRWMNNEYDAITDSEGKIALTAGSFFPAITQTASTTNGSAEVTISAEPSSLYVGMYIDIAGVTGPFQIIERDCLTDSITLDATADATVATGAITVHEPTFADGLKEKTGMTLLSSTTVAMGANNTKAVLYTVPAGKSCIVRYVVVRGLSAATACAADNDFGIGVAASGWKDTVDLSTVDATDDYYVVTPTDNTRIEAVYVAADAFGIQTDIGSAGSAVNATVEIFGYLF